MNDTSKYGNIYVDRAIDFLRGETGYVLMFGHRGWLPDGTTFDRINGEVTRKVQARLQAASEAQDWGEVVAIASRLQDDGAGEPPIEVRPRGHVDAEQWQKIPAGRTYPEELGQRFLLVAIRGEEQMWCTTYEKGSDMACAIVDLIQDRDYGFAAAVDLETMQMMRYTASVTLDPIPTGADWTPPTKSAP